MNPDAVVRNWFQAVWTNGDEAAIDRLMAPGCIAHGLPAERAGVGPAAFKPFYRSFRTAFPDIRVEVLRTVTEGNMVCAHCRVTATHLGDGFGMRPTGQRVDILGMSISRVENGQIQEGWNSFDFMALFQQIQALPAVTLM